ncbi:alpha/beta hydrolase family protein [Nocardioides pacificus]
METDLVVEAEDATLPATLTLPRGRARAGLVVLHGAAAGERSYFLYTHLTQLLTREGVAVLRYDRRPSPDGHDVPLHVQAADALAAARRLRRELDGVPIGLWAFSQGAWAATLAAATEPERVAFLVTVSCCGVTPAEQMRVACSAQLLQHGYDEHDVADMLAVRLLLEHYLRTGEGPEATRERLAWAATRPWSPHAYLPPTLPSPGSWRDLDFDPLPVLMRLTCPVLAFYGESDEWMPLEASIAAWRLARAQGALTDLEVVRLDGAGHLPTVGGRPDTAVTPAYSETLVRWLSSIP